MDSLNYKYAANTSRLTWVKDAITSYPYTTNIESQAGGNYTYDAIGNITRDIKEGISNIDWNVYGKISQIDKTNGSSIYYFYDASGNRIGKYVQTGSILQSATEYVRDASGNTMALCVVLSVQGG